jgi:hypothetical protein
MSLDSDLSSYSIISEAPSVHSLNTDGSANGGVIVASADEEASEDKFHDLPALEAVPDVVDAMRADMGNAPTTDVEVPGDFEDLPPLVALTDVPEDMRAPIHVTPTFTGPPGSYAVPANPPMALPKVSKNTRTPMRSTSKFTVPAGSYAVPANPPTASLPGFAEFLEQVRRPSPSVLVLNLPVTLNLNDAHIQSLRPSSTSLPAQEVAGFWLQFPGFVPQPKASFKSEFGRLAKKQCWNTKTKQKHQVEALTSEIDFHYGKCLDKLDRWQQLCKDVGIENIPTSITKCRKVSTTSVMT